MEDCLFCSIAAGKIPSTKVYEDDTVYVFKDIAPIAPIGVVIPTTAPIVPIGDKPAPSMPAPTVAPTVAACAILETAFLRNLFCGAVASYKNFA